MKTFGTAQLSASDRKVGGMDLDESSPDGGHGDAAATVAAMVRSQARWMSTLEIDDSGPPAALAAALEAEDWAAVRREWDMWVLHTLRDLNRSVRNWRALTATTLQSTVRELTTAAAGSLVPPAVDVVDEDSIMRTWLPWIRAGIETVKGDVRAAEWSCYSKALPVELRTLAAVHPEQQAEVAATTFEIEAFCRGLLGDEGV